MSTPLLTIDWIKSQLSPWTAWPARSQIQGATFRGVYLLGHFKSVPNIVDPTAKEVAYIGETHRPGRNLDSRWWEFDKSAFGPKEANHSGGNTYRIQFGNVQTADLYVSAMPVNLGDPHCAAFILAAERLLVWEYVQRHSRLPACNSE
jgi:hypothetical protein